MFEATHSAMPIRPSVSPLMLCDRLLTLAEDADRAGLRHAAEHLLVLASDVLDPAQLPRGRRRVRR